MKCVFFWGMEGVGAGLSVCLCVSPLVVGVPGADGWNDKERISCL